MVRRYRTRTEYVTALQWFRGVIVENGEAFNNVFNEPCLAVTSKCGLIVAREGDWIVWDGTGDVKVFSDVDFYRRYEVAEDGAT